uniref:TBCC domain-containing protein 1 n=4 Tax=Schistocephalus solidus TaxID=70667 RepID=A0A0X3P928_SCHSO
MHINLEHPISLWPRAELFIYGVFQIQPLPRLASHNIKKLVYYAKSKGRLGYPNISYSVWKHVACNKLQLPESVAWLYFQTCLILSTSNSSSLRELELTLAKAKDDSESEKIRHGASVELFVLVLFLYAQLINKLSLRSSVASTSAEWPDSPSRFSDISTDQSTPIRPFRNTSEQHHFQFIYENLLELLDLISEPEEFVLGSKEHLLSVDAVEALSFVLEGTVDQMNSIRPVKDIIFDPNVLPKTGYSSSTRTFGIRCLHSWIRSCLIQNPFTVETCILRGTRLQWTLPGGRENFSGSAPHTPTKRQRIATNAAHIPPTTGLRGNKLIVIASVSRQIIARTSRILRHATVKIHRANSAFIYLLSPLRSVTLDRCRGSTIVLGPIESTLFISGCEGCLVISAARRVVLAASRCCTLNIATPTRPVLLQPAFGACGGGSGGAYPACPSPSSLFSRSSPIVPLGNEEIMFGPYNTTYPELAKHLDRVCLAPSVNLWDQPLILGPESTRSECTRFNKTPVSGNCVWDILPPQDFYPFNIPMVVTSEDQREQPQPEGHCTPPHGRTLGKQLPIESLHDLSRALVTCPNSPRRSAHVGGDLTTVKQPFFLPLPKSYSDAISNRAQLYAQWRQLVKDASLSAEEETIFTSMIEQRFRAWLYDTGALRELQLMDSASASDESAKFTENRPSSRKPLTSSV